MVIPPDLRGGKGDPLQDLPSTGGRQTPPVQDANHLLVNGAQKSALMVSPVCSTEKAPQNIRRTDSFKQEIELSIVIFLR